VIHEENIANLNLYNLNRRNQKFGSQTFADGTPLVGPCCHRPHRIRS